MTFLPRILALLAFTLTVRPAAAQFGFFPGQTGGASPVMTASLAAGESAWVPGKPVDVALKLAHPEHWHTYWLNPGLGTPTTLKWELPAGWQASEKLLWPIPEVKLTEVGNQHVYGGTQWLFTTVTPPADLKPGETITLKASAKWLLCDEGSKCMPGGTPLELSLPSAAEAAPVAEVMAELGKVKAQQPQASPAWEVKLEPGWTVTLTPKEGANPDPGEVYFFDGKSSITNDPQKVTKEGGVIRITATPGSGTKGDPMGFVHASKGWLKDGSLPALAVAGASAATSAAAPGAGEPPPAGNAASATSAADQPSAATRGGAENSAGETAAPAAVFTDNSTPQAQTTGSTPPSGGGLTGMGGGKVTFWGAVLGLFLAGMVLNLMPCVFPVLALKVQSFVRQAGKNRRYTVAHSLAYTAGLLVFVWLVAGGMFVASRSFGLDLAWGDITRYTPMMAVLVIVLFLLALNLAGLFEIGTSLTTVGGELQDKKGYAGSFWSGAFTLLISTPCSAPLMAAPMGFALKQGAAQQFVLFTVFGLGIALPYVLLANSPALLKKLPRPGPWMESFKKALSFPMFAAAIFFFNSYALKTGGEGAALMLWSLLLLALAAWIYGRWCQPSGTRRARWTGGILALLALAGGGELTRQSMAEKAVPAEAPYMTGDLAWTRWSPEALAAERAKKRAVFVNYTTINCSTCEVNEKRVFKSPGSDAVIARFKSLNVAPLRAKYLLDGTLADNAIRDSLKPWGIVTYPAYIMYPADPSKPPFLVSDDLLSQTQVLEALEKAVN
ncbi:MAG: protein-disulfide reductase DsbD domain-containing protein [Verrucomicrobiota bacterium]